MKKYLFTTLSLCLLQTVPTVQAKTDDLKETTITLTKEDIKTLYLLRKRPIVKDLTLDILRASSTLYWGILAAIYLTNKEKSTNSVDSIWGFALTTGTILMAYATAQEFFRVHYNRKYNKKLQTNNFDTIKKDKYSFLSPSIPTKLSIAKDLTLGTLKVIPFILIGSILASQLLKKGNCYSLYYVRMFRVVLTGVLVLGQSAYQDISQGIANWKYRKNIKNNNFSAIIH